MSAPYNQQVELAALLTAAALPTDPEVASRYTPPYRYILGADPWLAAGQTTGQWVGRFRVVCVTAPGTTDVQAAQLANMTRAVILALRGTRFAVQGVAVTQPSEMATGSGTSLGASVNVATPISRAEFEGED